MMNAVAPSEFVDPAVAAGRLPPGGWWEHWEYRPGPVAPLPAHAHAEYQIGLTGPFPGEHRYRGAWHLAPPGALSVIHAGETHMPSARRCLPQAASYTMFFFPAGVFGGAPGRNGEPFFPPVVTCEPARRAFAALHRALAGGASALGVDERAQRALAWLLRFRVDGGPRRAVARAGAEHTAVRRAKRLLREDCGADVTLPELAARCGVSATHLSRVFHRDVGITLAAFQLQVRVEHARALLLAGTPLARAAADAGFSDQSHFTRAFRRLHGVTPARYAPGPRERKNVQDEPAGRAQGTAPDEHVRPDPTPRP